MAVAFDAASVATAGTGVSAPSWTHTCTGSNGLLLVAVADRWHTTANQISAIAYNSVSMTKLTSLASSNGNVLDIWYLKNPASGANTVQITIASAGQLVLRGASYTGVSQTTPLASVVTGQNADGAGAKTVTATGGSRSGMEFSAFSYQWAAPRTITCGNTQRQNSNYNYNYNDGSTGIIGGCSDAAGATSQAMTWTTSAFGDWIAGAVAVLPAAAAIPADNSNSNLLFFFH